MKLMNRDCLRSDLPVKNMRERRSLKESPQVPHSLFTNSWLELVSQIMTLLPNWLGCSFSSAGGKALYFKVNIVSEACCAIISDSDDEACPELVEEVLGKV